MPMFPEFAEVRSVVADAIESAGATMSRLDVVLPDPEWQEWLIQAIERADFFLADLTDHSPFVTYELGLAHSRRLPSVLIVNAHNDTIPATVRGTSFLVYDDSSLERFGTELITEIQATINAMAEPVLEEATSRAALLSTYRKAREELESLRAAGLDVQPVGQDEFCTRMAVAWARGDQVSPWCSSVSSMTVLARLIADSDRVEVMASLRSLAANRAQGSLSSTS